MNNFHLTHLTDNDTTPSLDTALLVLEAFKEKAMIKEMDMMNDKIQLHCLLQYRHRNVCKIRRSVTEIVREKSLNNDIDRMG